MISSDEQWSINRWWLWPVAPIIWLWRLFAMMLHAHRMPALAERPPPPGIASRNANGKDEPDGATAVEAVSVPPPPSERPATPATPPRRPTIPKDERAFDHEQDLIAVRLLIRRGRIQSAFRVANRLMEAPTTIQAEAWREIAVRGLDVNPRLAQWATTGLGIVLRRTANRSRHDKVFVLGLDVARRYAAHRILCPALTDALNASLLMLSSERLTEIEPILSRINAVHGRLPPTERMR
jgi:hypothetical protein